jgi:transcriptional regulator with XRE-family HTH domain
MPKALAPEVRAEFAQRLKELRVRSGYLRARYFARSLGIEENRYTRYERAEVEPNLTLIHKMCETLRVSPNELMGFAEYGGSANTPAFAEEGPENAASGSRAERQLALLAWRLASETVANRSKHRAQSRASADPLSTARETGKLFKQLQSDPFGTVAAIVADEDLKKLDARRKAEFADLIASYTEVAAQAAS